MNIFISKQLQFTFYEKTIIVAFFKQQLDGYMHMCTCIGIILFWNGLPLLLLSSKI